MKKANGWRSGWYLALLTLPVAAAGGCMGILHPLPPPPAEQCAPCQEAPDCCARIHIFMVNGLTILPHIYGSMNGVGKYVEQLGFPQPRIACHYWKWCFEDEIRRIHQEDPAARFVLVGYSIGGGVVYSIAQTLEPEGIFFDLIVYIDPHSFIHCLDEQPKNVGKVVNVYSAGPILGCSDLAASENYYVPCVWHLGAPRQEATLDVLARELGLLATACPCFHSSAK